MNNQKIKQKEKPQEKKERGYKAPCVWMCGLIYINKLLLCKCRVVVLRKGKKEIQRMCFWNRKWNINR